MYLRVTLTTGNVEVTFTHTTAVSRATIGDVWPQASWGAFTMKVRPSEQARFGNIIPTVSIKRRSRTLFCNALQYLVIGQCVSLRLSHDAAHFLPAKKHRLGL